MTKQYCVRTYEENYSGFQNNPCMRENCELLNDYLADGWKVVMVTPKPRYNEYIIEKEVKDKEIEKMTRKQALLFALGMFSILIIEIIYFCL